MARLYANANFPRPVADALRKLGHDVATVQETEGTSRPQNPMSDEQVLAVATADGRMVLTINRKHFIRLHWRKRPNHGGIVACKQDRDFETQAKKIHAAIRKQSTLTGELILIERSRKRKK